MRFEGTVSSWNEERGFGFIEPAQGGQPIFVHASAMPQRATESPLNQRLSFEVELNPQGKKRARNVQWGRAARPRRMQRPALYWKGPSRYAIPAFALVYLAATLYGHVPYRFAAVYLVMSLLCLMAYALDKSAARAGGWRIRESTLLWLGLLCGWPGAVLAQQWLRHKTAKPGFQIAFRVTVLLNVAAFLLLVVVQPKGSFSLFG